MSKPLTLITAIAIASYALTGCQKNQTEAQKAEPTAAPNAAVVAPPLEKVKSYGGPFGLAAKMSVDELKKIGFTEIESSPGLMAGKPPKPLNEPGDYIVVATPKAGLCRIRATFDVDNVNGSGDQIKTKVDRLAEAMKLKYGKYSEKVVHISQDVYRRNPEFWMMGLKEESIIYAYDWTTGKTEQPMPSGLANIEIVANALSMDKGYAAISYTFDNRDECMDEVARLKAANL
jgi:hypothetical protein